MPLVASTLLAMLGGTVLFGWWIGSARLTSVIPSLPTMKPNTAVAFVLSAVTLASLNRPGRTRSVIARLAAVLVIAFAIATIAEWVFDVSLGLDQGLFRDPALKGTPGRSSPQTAVAFLLLAIAQLTLDARGRRWRRTHVLAMSLCACATVLSVLGYLYGSRTVTGSSRVTGMAITTAIGLLVCLLGVLTQRTGEAPVRWLAGTSSAATLRKRALPAAILVAPAVGFFALRGEVLGWYDRRFTLALVTGTIMAVFVGVILRVGNAVEAVDERLAEARTSLEAVNVELVQLNRSDPLTSLGNRRALTQELRRLETGSSRYGHPYCMALFDVDHFKAFNDEYGHLAGDAVLRSVADELTAQARGGDLLFRYGGEEFLCIFPEQSLETGIVAAGRMRLGLERLAISHSEAPTGLVTVSAGVAALGPDRARSPLDVLKEADEALYQAKHLGRNRVEFTVPHLA